MPRSGQVRERRFLLVFLGGWRLMVVGGPVRGYRCPVWQQLTSIFEDYDPVAEQ
jgi:hypothetical protein